jgi:hypothetical protein
MLKKTSLLLLSMFFIGIANINSGVTYAPAGNGVNFEVLQVSIQPGDFHQMGTSARMRLSGNANNGNAFLFDGNLQIANGTYRVNGDLLVVNWVGHGTDDFLIISPTHLRDSLGDWRRM